MAESRKASIVPGDARSESGTPAPTGGPARKGVGRGDSIKPSGPLKLKKPAPRPSKPGNWRDGSVVDGEDRPKSKPPKSTQETDVGTTSERASPGPLVTQLDDNARDSFATGRPLDDSPEMVQCKHCKKSILKSTAKAHIDKCLAEKKETMRKRKEAKEKAAKKKELEDAKDGEESTKKGKKGKLGTKVDGKKGDEAVDADGDTNMGQDDTSDADAPGESASMSPEISKKPAPGGLKSVKKTAGKNTTDGEKKMGKKRKADEDAGKAPNKKKKKEEPKPKSAPKAKAPVDVERQCGVITPNGVPCARSLTCKSHSMGAKRAVPGRSLPYGMLLAAYQKKNQAKQQKAAIDANAPLEDSDDIAAGPVDSDEETLLVMNALSKWKPVPVVPQPVLVPIKKQYQLARLREQLDNATSNGTVNIFGVGKKNGQPLPGANGAVMSGGLNGTSLGDKDAAGDEDAEGEKDDGYVIGGATAAILPNMAKAQEALRRQSSGFAQMQQQRSVNVAGARWITTHSQGRKSNGRPVWEPPTFDYSIYSGEEYEKQREAVLKWYNGDKVKTTKFLDVSVVWRLLLKHRGWADEEVDHAMNATDHERERFFEGLYVELCKDFAEVEEKFEEIGVEIFRNEEGKYEAYEMPYVEESLPGTVKGV